MSLIHRGNNIVNADNLLTADRLKVKKRDKVVLMFVGGVKRILYDEQALAVWHGLERQIVIEELPDNDEA